MQANAGHTMHALHLRQDSIADPNVDAHPGSDSSSPPGCIADILDLRCLCKQMLDIPCMLSICAKTLLQIQMLMHILALIAQVHQAALQIQMLMKKQNKSMSSEPEISVTVEDLGVSLDIDINEDWDLGDIWDVMNLVDPESFEANEKETLKMIRKADRVCMPRELGDWITVKVKGGVRKGEGKVGERGSGEMQLQP
ncbi:hypothetical protein THAOC_21530, partial [Thalassiosira oceanica]